MLFQTSLTEARAVIHDFAQVESKIHLRLSHLKIKQNFQSCEVASNRAAFQIQYNTELKQKLGVESSSIITDNCDIRKLQLKPE